MRRMGIARLLPSGWPEGRSVDSIRVSPVRRDTANGRSRTHTTSFTYAAARLRARDSP